MQWAADPWLLGAGRQPAAAWPGQATPLPAGPQQWPVAAGRLPAQWPLPHQEAPLPGLPLRVASQPPPPRAPPARWHWAVPQQQPAGHSPQPPPPARRGSAWCRGSGAAANGDQMEEM
ncbi:unnamed protein product, partial [Prorocentrum cordatum]